METVYVTLKTKFVLIFLILFQICSQPVLAQDKKDGAIKITFQDRITKEAIPFANVAAYTIIGKEVALATTNMDGEAYLKPLPEGLYNVKGTATGYSVLIVTGVVVREGRTAYVTFPLRDLQNDAEKYKH